MLRPTDHTGTTNLLKGRYGLFHAPSVVKLHRLLAKLPNLKHARHQTPRHETNVQQVDGMTKHKEQKRLSNWGGH